MIPQKKPYVKPTITTIPPGTSKHKEIIAKIKAMDEGKKKQ